MRGPLPRPPASLDPNNTLLPRHPAPEQVAERLAGAAIGALMVGLLNAVGQVMFPELAYFVIFGPVAAILAFRPLGLFGKPA